MNWLHVLLIFLLFCELLGSMVVYRRGVDKAYAEGLRHGKALDEGRIARESVEIYKTALKRKLADSGRRHAPRPGAEPVVIHKAQLGSPPPRKPVNPS